MPRLASASEITTLYVPPPFPSDTREQYKREAKLSHLPSSPPLSTTDPTSETEFLMPELRRRLPTAQPLTRKEDADSPTASSCSPCTSLNMNDVVELELVVAGGLDGVGLSSVGLPAAYTSPATEEAECVGSGDSAIADTDIKPASPTPGSRWTLFSTEGSASPDDGVALTDRYCTKSILRSTMTTSIEASLEDTGAKSSSRLAVRFHPLALLLDAALEGDLDLVKRAAAEVSDVSLANDEGITALHNAVCAGRMDVADYLISTTGADVNAGDTDGWTPLHCAASCGNLPLARILVEHGAALHARTLSDHETPLEKCDQADEEAGCEAYLTDEQDQLGVSDDGRVYVLFPRGLEAAGPGSLDAYIEGDELAIRPNEILWVIDRSPASEPEWFRAKNEQGQQGLVPRAFISRHQLLRIPPASRPIPLPAKPVCLSRGSSSVLGDGEVEDIAIEPEVDCSPAEMSELTRTTETSSSGQRENVHVGKYENDVGAIDDTLAVVPDADASNPAFSTSTVILNLSGTPQRMDGMEDMTEDNLSHAASIPGQLSETEDLLQTAM